MKDVPATGKTLVIRTDFLSDSRWAAVCRAISGRPDRGPVSRRGAEDLKEGTDDRPAPGRG